MQVISNGGGPGGVAEWLKARAWKVRIGFTLYRGFESHPLRQLVLDCLILRMCIDDDISLGRHCH